MFAPSLADPTTDTLAAASEPRFGLVSHVQRRINDSAVVPARRTRQISQFLIFGPMKHNVMPKAIAKSD